MAFTFICLVYYEENKTMSIPTNPYFSGKKILLTDENGLKFKYPCFWPWSFLSDILHKALPVTCNVVYFA